MLSELLKHLCKFPGCLEIKTAVRYLLSRVNGYFRAVENGLSAQLFVKAGIFRFHRKRDLHSHESIREGVVKVQYLKSAPIYFV